MLKLGVLLSGGGRSLQNLLDLESQGQWPARIVVVGSSRIGAAGLHRARVANVPTLVADRKHLRDDDFHSVIAHTMRTCSVDLVCMAGFLSLWRIPSDFAGRVINIHPALLPKFGGPGMFGDRVHRAVLAAGERVSGCTVHFADNEYDHGPIIDQRTVPVLPTDTADVLAARVFEAEKELYPDVIRRIAAGQIDWGTHRTAANHAAPLNPGPRRLT